MKFEILIVTCVSFAPLSGRALSEESAKPKRPAKYFVEPMTCIGGLQDPEAYRGADSYRAIKMIFTSFKSTRIDGSLADSLEVRNFYGKTIKEVESSERYGEEFHMGPLRKDQSQVYRQELSGRDDDVVLEIKKTVREDGVRTDTLEGTYTLEGTTIGDYGYDLKCTAHVVKTPSRVDDFTAP